MTYNDLCVQHVTMFARVETMIAPHKKSFVYNKRAKTYEHLMKLHRYRSTLRNFIMSLDLGLPSEKPEILDLGCGTGITTEILKENFPKAVVTGFDYSKEMLKIYEERNPEIQIVQGDYNNELSFKSFPESESISFDSNRYDLVVSSTSISEYGLPHKIFPFVNRILKKNGVFLIIGITDNLNGHISGMIWGFKPRSASYLMQGLQESNFGEVTHLRIPWKLFPMNLMKYAISARKIK